MMLTGVILDRADVFHGVAAGGVDPRRALDGKRAGVAAPGYNCEIGLGDIAGEERRPKRLA